MRYLVALVAIAAWLLSSCGSASEPTAAEPPTTAGVATTPSTPHTTLRPGAPIPPSTPPPEPTDIEGRRFEVDGSVVWTRTKLDELPQEATVVRFTSTLSDSGRGLELCVGDVAASLPPQCGGPVVDGLDPTGWTQTVAGVTWGTRTVTVAWPPVDGHLTLVSDQPALQLTPIGDAPPDQLPAHCEQIANFVHRDTISFFARDNPDRTAGGRSVNSGAVVVLMVVEEHIEDVLAELTTVEAEPCLESVKYSTTELDAAQDRLREEGLYRPEGPVLGSGSGNALNRLTIDLVVADKRTISSVAELFDDPGLLYFTGSSEIIEGG